MLGLGEGKACFYGLLAKVVLKNTVVEQTKAHSKGEEDGELGTSHAGVERCVQVCSGVVGHKRALQPQIGHQGPQSGLLLWGLCSQLGDEERRRSNGSVNLPHFVAGIHVAQGQGEVVDMVRPTLKTVHDLYKEGKGHFAFLEGMGHPFLMCERRPTKEETVFGALRATHCRPVSAGEKKNNKGQGCLGLWLGPTKQK